MKIDIHVHTKKTKTGDSENRNISCSTFVEKIKATEIKILAITNHNHFDIEQYREFVKGTKDICQIWPGVELDISEDNRRGHLLIIVSPDNDELLSQKMNKLLRGTTEDKFTISIYDTFKNFDELDPVYIPHYYIKKPSLLDEDIDKLCSLVKNKNRVIKEATNSISAGIYISHGHKSIYGSDVQNWGDYIQLSNELPELRLPVESYGQFCLLLEKDEPTINTLLNQKRHDLVEIAPFETDKTIKLNLYNDINILFGSKGTGKTEILHAISQYYNTNGLKTSVYESSTEKIDDVYDLKGNDLNIKLEDINVDICSSEISHLKSAIEENITSLSNYVLFFSTQMTNQKANSIMVKDFMNEDIGLLNRKISDIDGVCDKLDKFTEYIKLNSSFNEIIDKKLFKELYNVLTQISGIISREREKRFIDLKSTEMFNQLIKIFNEEIAKKTGKPSKPIETGFYKYASNRIKIELSVNKIIENMNRKIYLPDEYVGNLGVKGNLYCKTEIIIQDGTISSSKFNTFKKINKTPIKEFAKKIKEISECLYCENLFEKISDLVMISGGEEIKDMDDLILFRRYFTINNIIYNPSNGESSMLLLHNELSKDKEIYLLDEPEKSLGNDYINDVIVPMLKEKAKMGKKVIIATHDANIAVRTLPYNSIYRKHEINKYSTYIGNPFINNLVNINNNTDFLNWKEISMKTLEGGRDAFGERGKIYGN